MAEKWEWNKEEQEVMKKQRIGNDKHITNLVNRKGFSK